MKQMSLTTAAIAASAFAGAALLSFGWSEERGVSLSVESAQARVGRPLTPVSVAGVARRQARRSVYGAGAYGAAAVGTAAAVAATSPLGWGGNPYYNSNVRGARAAYYGGSPSAGMISGLGTRHYAVTAYYGGAPWYGYNGWDDYAARNSIKCKPGTLIKLDDGLMYNCQ
jgi:hypothetical protein